uniref:Major facilitator superfamily (MFS) profile domain-containing protein n=1 Tax=Oncorhynchus tshawytscha TaxID=74940 RepID=A0A8C8M3U9_ONCTS
KMTKRDTEYQPLLEGITETKQKIKCPNTSLLLAICAACIGGTFQYGYNISIINSPTKSVQNFINQTWLERYEENISEQYLTLLWSSIVSIFTIGGFIGATIGGTLAIKFGRKGTLMMNNAFALLAALLMGLSYPTGLFELLIIGRFFTGVNAGIGICVQPLYLGEIAPRALRGAMAMGTSIFITGGILTGQVIGLNELLGKEEYWPILLSTTCIPAFLQLLILPWFPESPRYLLIDRGDDVGCGTVLHGTQNDSTWNQKGQPKNPFESLFLSECTIYFYTDYVFEEAGIPEVNIPYVTVGTGACECLTALTCGMLIESLGRKVLIIGGYTLMAFWCICFTLTLTFQGAGPWIPYLSMGCVFAFILSFGMGPGGVTNILITELFTQTTRPAAYMIGGSVNWLSFFFIGMAFPFIVTKLQQYCFLVFLVVCVLVAVYIFLVVPETKNKTFLEIQTEFQSGEKRKASKADHSPSTTLLSTPL